MAIWKHLASIISICGTFSLLARNANDIVRSTSVNNEQEDYIAGMPRNLAGGYDQIFHLLLFAASNSKDDFNRLAQSLSENFLWNQGASNALHYLETAMKIIPGDQNYERKIDNEEIKSEFGVTSRTIDTYLNKLTEEFSWYVDRGRPEQNTRRVHEIE